MIGVLAQDSDKGMVLYSGSVSRRNVQSFTSLLQWMREEDVESLWVYPDTDLSRKVQASHFEGIHQRIEWYTPNRRVYDGQPATLRMQAPGDIKRYVTFPAHMDCAIPRNGDRGQWTLPQPETLRSTVIYIEDEIGMPFIWSAGKVGEELLRSSHAYSHTSILPFDREQLPVFQPVLRGAMDRATWINKALSRMHVGMHVVGADKNGQYLGAANSVYVGLGPFQEVDVFDVTKVGFWQYEIMDVGESIFNGVDFPCPLDVKRKWASTELIKAARAANIRVRIHGGIIWQRKGRLLEKWANAMWAHRQRLGDRKFSPDEIAADNAQRTMKLIANSMVGRFMNEYSREYFHPDWQLLIIHQACASQMYTLKHQWKEWGVFPILVNKDAFYVLSDNPNPDRAFVPGFFRDKTMLRGFKPIGVCRLTQEMLDLMHDRKSSANDIEGAFKKAMGEAADV